MIDKVMAAADKCPWCEAEARDTFSFTCGSVRPSYVTPSACQSDKCKIGLLKNCLQKIVDTYPQRQMMLPHIQRAKALVGIPLTEKAKP